MCYVTYFDHIVPKFASLQEKCSSESEEAQPNLVHGTHADPRSALETIDAQL